jgi:dTDP-4-dehydrorhamnose reductase
MKFLITGANGSLGSEIFSQALDKGIQCHSLSHEQFWTLSECELIELCRGYSTLIHCAANTNLEECERNLDLCLKDNYIYTKKLADLAKILSIKMIYISSTGIYGEEKLLPYCEEDMPKPINHHHLSKYLGETAVTSGGEKNLIIRTGWLFGGKLVTPKNFVINRLKEAKHLNSISAQMHANVDQKGNPSYAKDVAERILEMIELDFSGIFNCVNEGFASRYEYVSLIIRESGIRIELIPKGISYFGKDFLVSANEMAINRRMANFGLPKMREWDAALLEYIQELRGQHPNYF